LSVGQAVSPIERDLARKRKLGRVIVKPWCSFYTLGRVKDIRGTQKKECSQGGLGIGRIAIDRIKDRALRKHEKKRTRLGEMRRAGQS